MKCISIASCGVLLAFCRVMVMRRVVLLRYYHYCECGQRLGTGRVRYAGATANLRLSSSMN
jgi:hypothetical protein